MDQPDNLRLISPNFSDLLTPNIEIGTFPDGDSHVRVPGISAFRGKEVTLFHRLYPHQNHSLVELLLVLDALKQENAKVTVVAPYMPYARQDKVFLEGEVASAKVVCNLLHRAGCARLITFDCHFLKQGEGEFVYADLPIKNISMNKALIEHVKKACNGEDFEVIAPDEGASALVESAGGKAMKKKRHEYKDDKITYRDVAVMEAHFEVEGKNFIILDDMISTGSTMIKAVEHLKEGGAKRICCAATHGLFLHNSLERLQAVSEMVVVTDSILSPVSKVSIIEQL